jgi:SAM-dependent methyltransferase
MVVISVSVFCKLRRDFGWKIEDHASFRDGVWDAVPTQDVRYPPWGHSLCSAVESDSYWFQYRNILIENLLKRHGMPQTLWEIGSGNGSCAACLQKAGVDVVAVEPVWEGAANAASRGIRHSICGILQDLQLPACSIEAVACFDVIEHLQDPGALLDEVSRVLTPGGRVAISVPAMRSLWSDMDEISGHQCRYGRKELLNLMGRHRFKPIACFYAMWTLVVPIMLMRALPFRLGKKRKTPEEYAALLTKQLAPKSYPLAALARIAMSMEAAFDWWIKWPFGSSLLGLFVKQAQPLILRQAVQSENHALCTGGR